MKIAIIGTRGIPARYGGFETCAEELAVGLSSRDHDISVYCRYNNLPGNPSKYKGVRLIYIPHIDSKNLGTLSHSFLSIIHSLFQKYDLVLAFNVGIAPLCIVPKIFGKRVILNVDGLEWKRKKWGFFTKKYFQICERLSPMLVDKIISDSKVIQIYFREKYNAPSIFIPYGANIITKLNKKILDQYGVKKDEYFFIASRLEPENNADIIVAAFSGIKTSKKLLIAGGANYSSSFIKSLMKIDDKRIKFLGQVYDDGHIESLHLGCFAYIHGNEVGGTNPALLKAMGYGNFIFALNVPFNREVVGDSAITFNKSVKDLRKKLKFLLYHPEIRQKYKKRAVERVKKYYTWNKIVDMYEKLFLVVISKSS